MEEDVNATSEGAFGLGKKLDTASPARTRDVKVMWVSYESERLPGNAGCFHPSATGGRLVTTFCSIRERERGGCIAFASHPLGCNELRPLEGEEEA